MLGETFELDRWEDYGWTSIAEQVWSCFLLKSREVQETCDYTIGIHLQNPANFLEESNQLKEKIVALIFSESAYFERHKVI